MKFMAVGFAALSALGCAAQKAKNEPPKYDEIVVNGEPYHPIKVVQPKYPAKAVRNHLSGQCIVEFTVTKEGKTKDHSLVWSSSPVFEQSCVSASALLEYPPLSINGAPVEITKVKYSFFFKIR